MDYTSSHKRNILSEDVAVFYRISSGSIIRFNYKGENVTTPRPLVLVLNPDFDNKLHGLTLEVLSEKSLEQLYRIVRETISEKLQKTVGMQNTKSIRIGNPSQYYTSKIKPFLAKQNENAYRTYNRNGITNVKTIDYRFKDYHSVK